MSLKGKTTNNAQITANVRSTSKSSKNCFRNLTCCLSGTIKEDDALYTDHKRQLVEPSSDHIMEKGDVICGTVSKPSTMAGAIENIGGTLGQAISRSINEHLNIQEWSGDAPGESAAAISERYLMHPDYLKPIQLAVSEVASASKLLTNALDTLKRCSSAMATHDSYKTVFGEGKKHWDLEAIISTEGCKDVVLDLPPMGGRCQIEALPLNSGEPVYHRAASNIRICIEDTDGSEPIRTVDQHNSSNKLGLSIPEIDNCPKAVYPADTSSAPKLKSSEPMPLHHAEEHVIHETQTNCQTLITGLCRPYSTEVTQVTEFDEHLSTDESELSDRAADRREQSIHPLSQSDRAASQPSNLRPVVRKTTQTFNGDHQPPGMSLFEPWTNISWSGSHTEGGVGDCVGPSRVKDNDLGRSRSIQEGGSNQLTGKVWSFSSEKPYTELLDTEGTSLDLLYQRNNHNRKSIKADEIAIPSNRKPSGLEPPTKDGQSDHAGVTSVKLLVESFDTKSIGHGSRVLGREYALPLSNTPTLAQTYNPKAVIDIPPKADAGNVHANDQSGRCIRRVPTCSIQVDITSEQELEPTRIDTPIGAKQVRGPVLEAGDG